MRTSATRTILHYLILILIHSFPLISCNPLPSPPSPRDMPLALCANAPNTLAGTFYIPSNSASTSTSTISFFTTPKVNSPWCAPHSKTYILIIPSDPSPAASPETAAALQTLLGTVHAHILATIAAQGDRAMPADSLGVVLDSRGGPGVQLLVQNANHEAVTWGVLGAAVQALTGLLEEGSPGSEVLFDIVDGTTRVGFGVLR